MRDPQVKHYSPAPNLPISHGNQLPFSSTDSHSDLPRTTIQPPDIPTPRSLQSYPPAYGDQNVVASGLNLFQPTTNGTVNLAEDLLELHEDSPNVKDKSVPLSDLDEKNATTKVTATVGLNPCAQPETLRLGEKNSLTVKDEAVQTIALDREGATAVATAVATAREERPLSPLRAKQENRAHLELQDPSGRTFKFPYHFCNTWEVRNNSNYPIATKR